MKLKIYFFILLILLPLAVLFIEIGLPDLQLRVWALERSEERRVGKEC